MGSSSSGTSCPPTLGRPLLTFLPLHCACTDTGGDGEREGVQFQDQHNPVLLWLSAVSAVQVAFYIRLLQHNAVSARLSYPKITHMGAFLALSTIHKEGTVREGPVVWGGSAPRVNRGQMALPLQHLWTLCFNCTAIEVDIVHTLGCKLGLITGQKVHKGKPSEIQKKNA